MHQLHADGSIQGRRSDWMFSLVWKWCELYAVAKHFCEILGRCIRQCSPTPSSKNKTNEEISCRVEFRDLEKLCKEYWSFSAGSWWPNTFLKNSALICICLLISVFPSSSTEYLFQLTAVLVHHGDMHSGHFVTYRRCPSSPRSPSLFSSQWLWVSDDSVRKASLHEVLSSNAYMLFYERVRRLNLALRSEE